MGGTDANHFLNTMGDGGNILQVRGRPVWGGFEAGRAWARARTDMSAAACCAARRHPLPPPQWKRKAEQYLIASGLNYTIIHPGGLIDEAGGSKQVVLDVDDKLLNNNPRNIPRADVAALAVGCIGLKEAAKRSFDCIAQPPAAGATPNNDMKALLAGMPRNCDYSINSQA
jgi:uncharacterized protein YbjT (DUF2867 family)